MSKIIGILLALPLMFGVAAPASAAVPASNDKLFYSLVTKDAPTLKAVSRPQLVKTARATCKFLRSGFTIMDAYEMMEENLFTEKEITAFIAGAIVFYCPEQADNY